MQETRERERENEREKIEETPDDTEIVSHGQTHTTHCIHIYISKLAVISVMSVR